MPCLHPRLLNATDGRLPVRVCLECRQVVENDAVVAPVGPDAKRQGEMGRNRAQGILEAKAGGVVEQLKLPIEPGRQSNRVKPPLEHEEQVALFRLIRQYRRQYPVLHLVAAIPNGGYRPKKTAVYISEEGGEPGYPDIACNVPSRGYHGAFVELKRRGEKPRQSQVEWIDLLRWMGYAVTVEYSCGAAWEWLKWYLELPSELGE